DGDDPALQRDAIVALDGLRPRDRQYAHAAREPDAALVSPDLEAARRHGGVDPSGLCLSAHRLFLGDRAGFALGLCDGAAGAVALRADAGRARHGAVVDGAPARELRWCDE